MSEEFFFIKSKNKPSIPKFTSTSTRKSGTNGWTAGKKISVFYPPQDSGNLDDDQTLNIFLNDLNQLITENSPFQYNTNYSIKNDYHYSESHFTISNEIPEADIEGEKATNLDLKFLFYGAVVDSNYEETPFSVCFSNKEKLIYFITKMKEEETQNDQCE